VIVKMEMTNETWYVVRNTRGVTGFVGSGNKPTPLSETDFASIFDSIPKTRLDIAVGDDVRILTGLFENFTGKVVSIDSVMQKISVVVPMLKRETTVELNYDEVVRAE
jgi:transcriptional antiterminator NusG